MNRAWSETMPERVSSVEVSVLSWLSCEVSDVEGFQIEMEKKLKVNPFDGIQGCALLCKDAVDIPACHKVIQKAGGLVESYFISQCV